MPTTIETWSPLTEHVQDDIPSSGSFLDAKTILYAAGPSRLAVAAGAISQADTNVAYPIGVLENVSVQQSKTIQRIFEIGSVRSYFVPGRMIGQMSAGRSMYNGPSLLKAFYNKILGSGKTIRLPPAADSGKADFWINMASDIFNYPFGLLMYICDNNLKTYGGLYLEECYFQGHQLSVNSQSTVIVEGASAQFDQAVPVAIPQNQNLNTTSLPVITI